MISAKKVGFAKPRGSTAKRIYLLLPMPAPARPASPENLSRPAVLPLLCSRLAPCCVQLCALRKEYNTQWDAA